MLDTIYGQYLAVLMAVFGGFLLKKGLGATSASGSSQSFKSFQLKFLFVYLTMMAADWMQGPYVYKLYAYYGFSRADNGVLFIAGFGSSLVFGTWSGPMADRYGRKMACMVYGVTYILSCLTKHFPNFWVLMLGRLLGGFATSILWSAFESWMVAEHNSRNFDASWVGSTFAQMITWNGMVAIASGFIAQWAVDIVGHPVAPFDVSAVLLALGTVFVYANWPENYGEQSHGNMAGQMADAMQRIRADKKIFFVGAMQSLFEGAMYTFVFMWTPALETPNVAIPHGIIFACFMTACSIGGTLFGMVEKHIPVVNLMKVVFGMASAAMAVPMMTSNPTCIMGAFVVFEVMVGMFWPGIGTLRSKYLPEECRATVINIFRMPLNTIVCLVLFYQGGMTIGHVFTICTIFHGLAAVMAVQLDMQLKYEIALDKHSEEKETAVDMQ